MSLQKENVYLDDWKDLKAYTEELEKEEAEKRDQYDVTKDFVGDQIDEYKEYDEAKEQAEYKKIYQKIADISAGGGVDLSPYLKKADAEETYAKKEDIEWIITNEQFNDAVEEKVNAGIQGLVNGASEEFDTFKEVGDSLTVLNTEVAKKANSADVESTYAKKSEIPSVDEFATKAEVNAALENKADKSEIPSTDDFATKEELAQKADKTEIPDVSEFATKAEVNTALENKADKSEIPVVPTKVSAFTNDAGYLTEHQDLSDYAKKSDIPSVDDFVTEETVNEKVAEGIAKVVADAPEDFDTLKEVADYIASDKTKAAEIETAIGNLQNTKADASTVYTKVEADAKFLTEHQDLSNYATTEYVNSEIARVEDEIPSVENFATKDELATVEAKIPSVEGLVSVEQLNEAVSPKANSADVEATYAKKTEIPSLDEYATKGEVNTALENKADKAEIPTVPTKVSAFTNDAGYLTEHQDLSEYATKSEVNTALENKADKADIPSVEGFATQEQLTAAVADKATIAQVAAVDQKVDAIDLNPYATKNDVSVFATKEEVADKADAAEMTAALADKATIAQVAAVDQKVDAIDLTPYATKEEVAVEDTSVLQNILGRIWTKKTANPSDGYFYTKLNTAKGYSLLFNESDGGGSQFKDDKTISYVGVNDGGTDTSTGIFAQIYSKDIATNEGARLNINPSGMFYGVGAKTPIDAAHELAVKGDIDEAVSGKANSADVEATYAKKSEIPSVEGFATKEELTAGLSDKATIDQVSTIDQKVDTKANADDVVPKADYLALKAKTEYLEQLILEYAEGAEDEVIADGEISDLSPENKSVNIVT